MLGGYAEHRFAERIYLMDLAKKIRWKSSLQRIRRKKELAKSKVK